MNPGFSKSRIAVAVTMALGAAFISTSPAPANAAKTTGQYLAGDFHNHTTCSDGSTSMQKLVKKSTDKTDTPWGLDWFVQAGHGGSGNRNCTLVEDETLATPAYPFLTGDTPFNTSTPEDPSQYNGPQTAWAQSIGAAAIKGDVSGSGAGQRMWRWQSLQEYQYQVMEYLNAYLNKPMFLGLESVVAGHEHSSMSVITGQIPVELDSAKLPETGPYVALGNADALSMWTYCFDRATSDTSRGNRTGTTEGNNWDCSVPGSLNAADPSWNAGAAKLVPAGGIGTGERGHNKTVEAIKWMAAFHPDGSYYVPAHLERPGPFNPNGNNGYNVEHLRNFNNAGPRIAFGFESQPGHHAASSRGEYRPLRNNFGGGVIVDSVGGTTYGGTGVYAAQVGGVWDALLGEGRNWWFFGSSDWHNRGVFGPDDRRSTFDFYPGEYQRNYTMVRTSGDPKLNPQQIVDGLRSGNGYVTTGQLINRLAFVACIGNPAKQGRSNQAVESLTLNAALNNTDLDFKGCATMGEKLVVPQGADVVVAIVVRDPVGTNYSPYTFNNPSLLQVDIEQPLNKPVLHHIDVIRGMVITGYKQPGDEDYAGEWPRDWLSRVLAGTASLDDVPAAAKNATASVIRTFNASTWSEVRRDPEYKVMSFRIPAVQTSQYVRLRGTNLPPGVPYETDADGNPLPDLHTNARNPADLRISCATNSENIPSNTEVYKDEMIDGCPAHMPVVEGLRYSAFDVAAWADLWFYSNPIFIEVPSSTLVAGVN